MKFQKKFILISFVWLSTSVYVLVSLILLTPSIAMAANVAVVPGPVVPVAVVPGPVVVAPLPGPVVVPPPIVLAQPPQILLAPAVGVEVVVGVPYDLVVVNNIFYRYWNGLWFSSYSYDGTWIGVTGNLIPGVL